MPTIERTLVKSPPELWELVDDVGLMARWSAELFGVDGVRVVERHDGEQLVWEAEPDGARVELALAEKGWGTNVSIRVIGPDVTPNGDAAASLEALLDELASPQRRPFSRT